MYVLGARVGGCALTGTTGDSVGFSPINRRQAGGKGWGVGLMPKSAQGAVSLLGLSAYVIYLEAAYSVIMGLCFKPNS